MHPLKNSKGLKIAIIGLGYVGLPLALAFSKKFDVVGFDISEKRINELKQLKDHTLELEHQELEQLQNLTISSEPDVIASCNFYIVTVPTPIDYFKQPDLTFLIESSKSIGLYLKKGDIVVYESTVYPGATEEICIPVLEKYSQLIFNQDFFVGYSPERINPGDKKRKVTNIKKVTSGSTPEVANFIDLVYREIIVAGTYKAPSIKIAEAAKVIENTQRDVNIALMNELSLIFNRLDIDTEEVLKAAETKWNFLPFRPGLVGGHCISVDPYYLTHKAQSIGLHPEIILAARRLNDRMGEYVATQLIKAMVKKQIQVVGGNILVMGLSFKENCPDIRNTKIIDLIQSLKDYDLNLDIYDPWVNPDEVKKEYQLEPIQLLKENHYDAIVLAIGHQNFIEHGYEYIRSLGKENCVIYDLKHIFKSEQSHIRL
ncbi:Vi polysaccharide biosynthesis UDP-N-acetylglucosamine C-6 dehydrogenase TviB [Acinetobacter bereziniae]|jgi:UDP-N-acetyl-D-galactosamine dehydrogenase|uniref:Vi polysaccharide biosynthesis UDP-N-acetylglucosamine C-6 dehydrogenase TviB n=1 Tax=Acinetobacter bereziniae TaxID=106648 RepID=UPI001902194D|nr:Vi polysaccharide biosynthesis UDP-N-acetylglucosamine C-6 dehydrogenase TviB [Acinetobacter bereziniae]MBJ8444699.1 Vi polysaccharide biosynthesis UDP-N-acetylglucosamine C-6 dehydrogenase TviB [Acinetobacter bereziniae]MDM1784349.1 Vi polysaccharide biosynthesis UDP-N-acetylglucosamine C-6 dehydrogenase TviB [Acinetobacter bereziniae]